MLRDLIARITFQTDPEPLRALDRQLASVSRQVTAIAGTVLSGWALRSGQSILVLNEQLRQVSGTGFGAIREAIDTLAPDGDTGIFSKEATTRAALALRELGFEGGEVAEMLKTASLLAPRLGGDLEETARRFGAGIQEGGLENFFRQIGLLGRVSAENLRIIEDSIVAGSGKVAPRMARMFREGVAGLLDPIRPELEKSLAEFEASPAGPLLRLQAGAGNLWNKITTGILTALGPALDKLADLTVAAQSFIDKFVPVREFGDWLAGLFKNPVAGTTALGGILMFLLTRNPIWIAGGIIAGDLLGTLHGDLDGVIERLGTKIGPTFIALSGLGLLLSIATRNWSWFATGTAAGLVLSQKGDKAIDQFLDENIPEWLLKYMRGNLLPGTPGGLEAPPPPAPPEEPARAPRALFPSKSLGTERRQGVFESNEDYDQRMQKLDDKTGGVYLQGDMYVTLPSVTNGEEFVSALEQWFGRQARDAYFQLKATQEATG